jgi:NADH:ubiquinone oxidoreductase subunit C
MPTLVEREHCAVRGRPAGGQEATLSPHHHFREPRFELAQSFGAQRLRVHTRERERASVPTISDLWPGTSFSERECYDMFGIVFEAHPDLRRLLMPVGFEHHPLRKDYPHHGIEPDRLYRTWDRERRKDWNAAT